MSPDLLEQHILRLNDDEIIKYLMENNFILKELNCSICNNLMNLTKYKRNIDKYAWRCMTKDCKNFSKYFSIRLKSFFEGFNISIVYILRVIIKYSCRVQRFSINNSLDLSEKTIRNIINNLISKIPFMTFENNKLGGPNIVVQIDETMLNYKCKSHRGRSPNNKTDAICIIEFSDKIERVFACVIPNKKSETMIPIITQNVANGSKIWTDEHRSYQILRDYNYIHQTVCHKYQFITDEGINTQAVESFNNIIKCEIKKRKGILTLKREDFLREIVFLYNHKNNLLFETLNLIKI